MSVLAYTLRWLGADTVIHGAALGIDTTAGDIARAMRLVVVEVPAEWHLHGKAAGPMRNEKIAEIVKSQGGLCLSVYRAPWPSKGTADAQMRAQRAGLVVHDLVVTPAFEELDFRQDVFGTGRKAKT